MSLFSPRYTIANVRKVLHEPDLIRDEIEYQLSKLISNDMAFKIADVGRHRDIESYDIPISPFTRYYVDPEDISRVTGREWKPWSDRKKLLGAVKSGNWDVKSIDPSENSYYPENVENYDLYISLKEYLNKNLSLEETTFHQHRSELGSGESSIREHFDQTLSLLENISQDGYLNQEELGNYPNNKRMRYADEITVDVGRNGELLHVDGMHRLIVAKALDLDFIPVVVLVRHKKWVQKLKQIEKREHLNGISNDHPDVLQIINLSGY